MARVILRTWKLMKRHWMTLKDVREEVQKIIDAYNKNAPSYKRIFKLKIRENEFEKNTTKKSSVFSRENSMKSNSRTFCPIIVFLWMHIVNFRKYYCFMM